MDHHCMNQIMDGTYDCEYCYPEREYFNWDKIKKKWIKCAPARGIDRNDEVTSSGGERK